MNLGEREREGEYVRLHPRDRARVRDGGFEPMGVLHTVGKKLVWGSPSSGSGQGCLSTDQTPHPQGDRR